MFIGGELSHYPSGSHTKSVDVLGKDYSVKAMDPVLVLYTEFGVRRVVETFCDSQDEPYEYFEVLGRLVMESGLPVITMIDGVEHLQAERLELEMKNWLKGHLTDDLGEQVAKRVMFL